MKLQADRIDGTNAIARHSVEGVVVNGAEYTHSVLVPWQGPVCRWEPADFAALAESHFEAIFALSPDLVIFGSGPRQRFTHPRLTRSLLSRRIGIETMDTPAACRTYNVLLSEGRSVVAALLFA